MKVTKLLLLGIYYGCLRHLPDSNNRLCGRFCKLLRYSCCRHIFKKCGYNVNIEKGASFGSGRDIEIGDNSGMGINADLPNNIIIGDNVMMGKNVTVFISNHRFDSIEIPMCQQGMSKPKPTIIEDDVWIGANVIMTPGRIIKTGSIVGAGCILTKNFPAYSIIGGNPGKIIRYRTSDRNSF